MPNRLWSAEEVMNPPSLQTPSFSLDKERALRRKCFNLQKSFTEVLKL